MNYGGIDYVQLWSPWQSQFLWIPKRIKINNTFKWYWLRTVYYRTQSWNTIDDRNTIGSTLIKIEYAMHIFDILKKS